MFRESYPYARHWGWPICALVDAASGRGLGEMLELVPEEKKLCTKIQVPDEIGLNFQRIVWHTTFSLPTKFHVNITKIHRNIDEQLIEWHFPCQIQSAILDQIRMGLLSDNIYLLLMKSRNVYLLVYHAKTHEFHTKITFDVIMTSNDVISWRLLQI